MSGIRRERQRGRRRWRFGGVGAVVDEGSYGVVEGRLKRARAAVMAYLTRTGIRMVYTSSQ